MNEVGRVDDFRFLVLRSGAGGDVSRRTLQIAPMAARTGPSFESSADAEPPQDEVLGYAPIHVIPPKYHP
jgi:hypothetical protein